jgi:transposase
VTLTGGNRHDVTQLIPPVEAVPPIRCRRSGDGDRDRGGGRGSCSPTAATTTTSTATGRAPRGITPRIARRGVAHGSGLGKQRWVVQRSFAWLHAFKRLRTRYERRADIHLGLLQLACALICYRQLAVAPE